MTLGSVFILANFYLGMDKLKSIFPDFDDQLLDRLRSLGETVVIPPGEPLLRPGQYLKSTILVLDGTVKLFLEGRTGEELLLYFLEPGSLCALSIICATSQNIDIKAIAMTDVTLMLIPIDEFDRLIVRYPKWYHFLLESYHARFKDLLHSLNQIAFHSMDERLVTYLRQLFAALNSRTVSITHQEIASDLNSSREVVSRLLKRLETENRISISRNEITDIALSPLAWQVTYSDPTEESDGFKVNGLNDIPIQSFFNQF